MVAGTPIEEWARSVTAWFNPCEFSELGNYVQDKWGKIQLIQLIQESFHLRQIWHEPGWSFPVANTLNGPDQGTHIWAGNTLDQAESG